MFVHTETAALLALRSGSPVSPRKPSARERPPCGKPEASQGRGSRLDSQPPAARRQPPQSPAQAREPPQGSRSGVISSPQDGKGSSGSGPWRKRNPRRRTTSVSSTEPLSSASALEGQEIRSLPNR